jgi:hypothetical protein
MLRTIASVSDNLSLVLTSVDSVSDTLVDRALRDPLVRRAAPDRRPCHRPAAAVHRRRVARLGRSRARRRCRGPARSPLVHPMIAARRSPVLTASGVARRVRCGTGSDRRVEPPPCSGGRPAETSGVNVELHVKPTVHADHVRGGRPPRLQGAALSARSARGRGDRVDGSEAPGA